MAAKPSFSSVWTQFFPPKPQFTDQDIPKDLAGKVYLVTGANSGMGKELTRVLYERNAKVYAACRSEERAKKAINDIKKSVRGSKGELVFLPLDLADLNNVKTCAETFLARESKLHVLFNNAGVMVGPFKPIPRTVQGHELALGVNCVGTFLLTRLLTPTLAATAKAEPLNTVRVLWVSSFGLMQFAPNERGVDMDNLDFHDPKDHVERYGISKCGDWLLAVEYGRLHKADGIISVPMNPGNVYTSLARDQNLALKLIAIAVVYKVMFGVYTQLFSAFSPEITAEALDLTKDWVSPWGRILALRPDLPKATKPEEEGGNGNAQRFWEWNEAQVKEYL